MVTSVESHATRAGVNILEAGGNAVDAAVAVGYALAVTHPSAGNIGGGGFMLIHSAGKAPVAIDFRERAPAALTQKNFDRMISAGARDAGAVGVPGSVAGLNYALDHYGSLPRHTVMAGAITLAADGHAIGARQALSLGWNWKRLKKSPEARKIFGNGQRAKRQGERLVQPDLARTLRTIAQQGNDGFYAGATAKALSQLGKHSLLTEADLIAYRALERQPLSFDYRGYQVDCMPPPSAGGVAVALMLQALGASLNWPGTDPGAAAHWFIEVAKRAHAHRRFHVVDPDSTDPGSYQTLRKNWLQTRFLLDATPVPQPTAATPSAELHPLYEAARKELEHTTHFSVMDQHGLAVTVTTTLSAAFGAKLIAPGTGVVLNNSVAAFGTAGADVPAPGRRMTSSMSPTLVRNAGHSVLLLGSPGGDTIPNTVVQILSHIIDDGMTLSRAIDAPRLHHGFVPDQVRYERRRWQAPKILEALKSRGHKLHPRLTAIGDANNIMAVGDEIYGYADPREGGLALGPSQLTAAPPTP
ncbi:MAG: gamma-glutamyltransferase [Polyangiaceae bacterium]|nr:gamma-glutamyltransferase [Polyangiaceae bacterium]